MIDSAIPLAKILNSLIAYGFIAISVIVAIAGFFFGDEADMGFKTRGYTEVRNYDHEKWLTKSNELYNFLVHDDGLVEILKN